MIGDIEGHGIAAATQMDEVRDMLRALVFDGAERHRLPPRRGARRGGRVTYRSRETEHKAGNAREIPAIVIPVPHAGQTPTAGAATN